MILTSYQLALLGCFITMICWGSWSNVQKATQGKWPFQFLYWDYTMGFLLISLLMGFFIKNEYGFLISFLSADFKNILFALFGGIIFNVGNILIVVAIEIAGLAIAFPLVMGIAMIWGVFINYLLIPNAQSGILFTGVSLVIVAIFLNSLIYKLTSRTRKSGVVKGILISVIGGLILGSFYFFIAKSMSGEVGGLPAINALILLSIGAFIANLLSNSLLMKKPIIGDVLYYKNYFKVNKYHLYGLFGGLISGLGTGISFISSEIVAPAIAYGLAQGSTLVAVLWGIFYWKEFKDVQRVIGFVILLMLILYSSGLVFIAISGQ